jgi:hypothetical protein
MAADQFAEDMKQAARIPEQATRTSEPSATPTTT